MNTFSISPSKKYLKISKTSSISPVKKSKIVKKITNDNQNALKGNGPEEKKPASLFILKTFNKLLIKLGQIRRNAGTGSLKYISRIQRTFVGDKSDSSFQNTALLRKFSTSFNNSNGMIKAIIRNLTEFFEFVFKTSSKLLRMIPVMSPDNTIYMLFEILSALLIAFILIITSISLCFKVSPIHVLPFETWEKNKLMYQILMSLSCFVFFADILCSFFTSYYDAGELIKKRSSIRINYIKTNFLWDLISCIPVYINTIAVLLSDGPEAYKAPFFIDLLFFFKFKDLVGTFEKVNELISIRENLEIIFSLVKLALQILLISHTAACLWYFMSSGEGGTWITAKQIDNETLKTKYIYSLYWALTTLATVGYGDITPQNPKEMIFALAVMLIGSALFGYSLNKIGNLLDNMNKKDNELKKKLKVLDWYMNEKNINLDLQKRLRKHFEFKIKSENSFLFLAEELIQKNLSGNLKEEFQLECYNKILHAFPVITENFSATTIKKLTSCIKTLNYRPGDLIEKKGEHKEPLLYFIYKGSLGIFLERGSDSGKHVNLYKKGDSFGEYCFFTDREPDLSLTTTTFTTLLVIEKGDFLDLIRENKQDYEKFCEIRDRLLQSQDLTILKKLCNICSAVDHNLFRCPQVFLKPNNVIARSQYCPIQMRSKCKRAKFSQKRLKFPEQEHPISRKLNGLGLQNFLQSSIKKYHELNRDYGPSQVEEKSGYFSSKSILEIGEIDESKSIDLDQTSGTIINPPPNNNTKFMKRLRREKELATVSHKSRPSQNSIEPIIIANKSVEENQINLESESSPNSSESSEKGRKQKPDANGKNSHEKEKHNFGNLIDKTENMQHIVLQNPVENFEGNNPKIALFLAEADSAEEFINYFPHFNKKVVLGMIIRNRKKKN